jgi:2',3'-cyclic-nucleotide 2'-phosphodiesterase (5'-nucleotidase family)
MFRLSVGGFNSVKKSLPLTRPAKTSFASILVAGDVRSNFLPVVNGADTECPPTTYGPNPGACIGGVHRLAAYVQGVRENATNPVIVVDTGNTFQGALHSDSRKRNLLSGDC